MKSLSSENALRHFPLWAELPDTLFENLRESWQKKSFTSKEVIFSEAQEDRCLCVLLDGRAHVYACSPDPTHRALLRTMESGAIFGVHTIFSSDIPAQSCIIADGNCTVLYIPAEVWEKTLTFHAPTMAVYIRFLTQRIQFLNQKIQYLTAGSAERRLALFLLCQICEEDSPVRLNISAVSLADLLALGRASLYRAMDRLTADGYLERNGHEYILHHRAALATHYT